MNQSKTTLFRSRNLEGLVFLSPDFLLQSIGALRIWTPWLIEKRSPLAWACSVPFVRLMPPPRVGLMQMSRMHGCWLVSFKVSTWVHHRTADLSRKSACDSIEAEKPTQNPEIPKKHRVHANFFEKFGWTFAFFPVTRVRSRMEIVQKNLFRWTFLFWVDFFGWIFLPWFKEPSEPPPCRSVGQDFYQTYARITGNQGSRRFFWGLFWP